MERTFSTTRRILLYPEQILCMVLFQCQTAGRVPQSNDHQAPQFTICMIGLAPNTQNVFNQVSTLECIKPYILVGGTALSLQINTRQSEDLDFMKWRSAKDEKFL